MLTYVMNCKESAEILFSCCTGTSLYKFQNVLLEVFVIHFSFGIDAFDVAEEKSWNVFLRWIFFKTPYYLDFASCNG